MGQKVNPYGIRLGINKTWSSRWFSKNEYTKLLHQDLKIKEYEGINIHRKSKKNKQLELIYLFVFLPGFRAALYQFFVIEFPNCEFPNYY